MSVGLRDQLRSTLDAGLHAARARECNSATDVDPEVPAARVGQRYGVVTASRLAFDLTSAIRHACSAASDSEVHCLALIAECTTLPQEQQLDLLNLFRREVRRFNDARTPRY